MKADSYQRQLQLMPNVFVLNGHTIEHSGQGERFVGWPARTVARLSDHGRTVVYWVGGPLADNSR